MHEHLQDTATPPLGGSLVLHHSLLVSLQGSQQTAWSEASPPSVGLEQTALEMELSDSRISI